MRLAVERLLEIIGEAASAMSDEGRSDYAAIEWRDMTRLRIVLAHHYHRIDSGQVWTIASHDVSWRRGCARLRRELSLPTSR